MIQHRVESRGNDGDQFPPTLGYVAACPRLIELTVVLPYPHSTEPLATRNRLDPAGRARSAISELVVACKALPDFDTLQIVHFPLVPSSLLCQCRWGGCGSRMRFSEQRQQTLKEQMKDLEDWAIECLKKSETRCREGEERKRITLRVLRFSSGRPCHSFAKVEREV